MKSRAILTMAVTLAFACGRGKSANEAKAPSEVAPEFSNVPEDPFGIELSMSEGFDFQIRMKKQIESIQFEMNCVDVCPIGISLSKEGVFSWVPHPGVDVDRFFSIEVSAKTQNSLSSKKAFEFRVTSKTYKIGNSWDRKSITQLPSNSFGDVAKIVGLELADNTPGGTVEYLGEFEGKHLILSALHVFSNVRSKDGIKCDDDRIFYFSESKMAFSCSREVFTSSLSDYAIYEVKPLSKSGLSKPVEVENYPKFSARIEAPGQPLSLAGYGGFQNPYRDLQFSVSENCVTYLTSERKVDYSKVNGINSAYFKNPLVSVLGAPCEASNGDSGGPLFLRNTAEIVGIVSAGSLEKLTDEEVIGGLSLTEADRQRFARLSYVSSLTMFNEITTFIKSPGPNVNALKLWLEKQYIKESK